MSYDIAKQIEDSLDEMIFDAAFASGFGVNGENFYLSEHTDLKDLLYGFADELLSKYTMMIAIHRFDYGNKQ